MIPTKLYKPRFYDPLLGWFFRFAASGYIPANLFVNNLPNEENRAKRTGDLSLEIVSHCWQYSNMLAYQLSSFVNNSPTKMAVTVTVFFNSEDKDTKELLDFFSGINVENVTWNWQELPKEQLFRRGIGRNIASRATKADWVWYTDCDIQFHKGCLDTLAEQLQGRNDILLFPREEATTSMLPESDPMLQEGRKPQVVDIDTSQFTTFSRDRAKGAFQIVHGDVARAVGYCEQLSIYQTPADHWCKCYEDRAFRWLVRSQGVPIDIPGVFQIRHVKKGRYKANSLLSRVRSKIRRIQE